MASKVEIANMALHELGKERITSFSDGTRHAVVINDIYESIVDEVVCFRDWSAAAGRASLAQTADTPDFEWDYEYQLPTSPKCLKVRQVQNSLGDSDIEYEIEGDKLVTNETAINLKYTKQLTSSSDYGIYLTTAIYKRLVAALAYYITGDKSLEMQKMQEYLKTVELLYAEDGLQRKSVVLQSKDLINVRY